MSGVIRQPNESDEFSARQLADLSGISATTLVKWARRSDDPLPSRPEDRRTLYRWGDLVAFARAHRELQAARGFLNRIRSDGPDSTDPAAIDPESLRSIAQYARAAAAAASDAAVKTAELHLETVRSLRIALAALDHALIIAMPAETMHD